MCAQVKMRCLKLSWHPVAMSEKCECTLLGILESSSVDPYRCACAYLINTLHTLQSHKDENLELMVIFNTFLQAKHFYTQRKGCKCNSVVCDSFPKQNCKLSPKVDTEGNTEHLRRWTIREEACLSTAEHSRLPFHPHAQSIIPMERCRSVYRRIKITQYLMEK